jgi:hypothetical protein
MIYSSTGTNNLTPSNFYQGMLYGFCISADPNTEFPSGPKDTCPPEFEPLLTLQPTDPAYCLINCDHDKYPENGECNDCRIGCPYDVCIRGDNCNLCIDDECDECAGFETECITCIEGAELIDGDCVCTGGLIYESENHRCRSICEDNCETCTGSHWMDCLTCAEGYFKFPDTNFCWIECPTGSVADSEAKTCSDPGDIGVFCLTFNNLI